jgi:hypothetical protein
MIQLLNPLDIQTLHKTLPKKLSHIKEKAKVKFIKEAVRLYRTDNNFGKIDFSKSTFDGINITIIYSRLENKTPIEVLVHDIMEKWYFSNLEKNENVYFYRFINIFRAELSTDEWSIIDNYLKSSLNLTLCENYKQYTNYRKKLDNIDQILSNNNFNAREFY